MVSRSGCTPSAMHCPYNYAFEGLLTNNEHLLQMYVLAVEEANFPITIYNQEHIEPQSGEGACNSACYPGTQRNSKIADVVFFHIRKKYDVDGVKDAKMQLNIQDSSGSPVYV